MQGAGVGVTQGGGATTVSQGWGGAWVTHGWVLVEPPVEPPQPQFPQLEPLLPVKQFNNGRIQAWEVPAIAAATKMEVNFIL